MTKMIKLSLAAAVAVAGFTTSAAAADLSNTTFSGKVEFEYDYTKNDDTEATTNQYDIDVDVKAKTKLSDTWTSIVVAQADTAGDVDNGQSPDVNGNSTVASADGKNLSRVNIAVAMFQYSNGSTTLKIGRQGGLNATPYFDDERGDGFVATHTFGSVTLAAAHVENINNGTVGDEAVNAAAIIGSFGPVNASLWAAEVGELDSQSLNVNGKFGIVSAALTHTELDTGAADSSNSLTKLVVSAPVGPVTLTAGYGTTDSKGGTVAFNNDASAAFTLDNVSLNGQKDADAILVAVSGKIGAVTASLSYLDADLENDGDADETLVKVAYPLAKALKVTASYSDYSVNDVDQAAASVALEYKF